MTVQELINNLNKVKNKHLPVVAVIRTGEDDMGAPFIEESPVFEVDEEERCVSIVDEEVSKWARREIGGF